MKNILGLDLGTNSIGWAVISTDEDNKPKKIEAAGSRIIPMSQDILSNFDKGNSISQTAERTGFRGTRRLRERHLLRRERLHRILHIMNFLPKHYEQYIDFEKRFGQFVSDIEPKLAWKNSESGGYEFLFQKSFNEMLADFEKTQPELLENNKKVPYDWTIYYLRTKALREKIEKEELAWVFLNFNQKRGYYQLRGEDEDKNPNKLIEYHALKVIDITEDTPQKGKTDIWYNITLENGWVYRRSSKVPLYDWVDKIKEFIVTTDLNDDGTIKKDNEGCEKRSFRAPAEDDWGLLKNRTEADIEQSGKTVGTYIYETILQKPNQKVRGKLVRTIERKFYKEELFRIIEKQKEFHIELNDKVLFTQCIEELYTYNESHRSTLQHNDFTRLFIDDIIFYQRPLKSKKSLISNCQYEYRIFKNEAGIYEKSPIKCIAKSHPAFQEFRLWQFMHNLRIYEREKDVNDKLQTDVDVTGEFLPDEDKRIELFDWLNDRKDITQDVLLSKFFKKKKAKNALSYPYRWNYVEDKEYPCNETRGLMIACLQKADIQIDFLNRDMEVALWHLLYSVEDKNEIQKALSSFAEKHSLPNSFVEVFSKFPPFKKDYGAYSLKAINKLLPLMRIGKYWNEENIDKVTISRINSINERLESIREENLNIEAVSDDDIPKQVLRSFMKTGNKFSGLNTYQACYAVYDRHSEASKTSKWNTPQDIDNYLKEFKQHSLRNPIVEQVITETLRVVRDIWKNYGYFSEIHLELGREMKNPADKRKRITAKVSENENTNLRIKALLMEFKNQGDIENVRPYSPSQQELLKIYEDGVLNSNIEIDDDILKISKSSNPTKSELIRYKLWLEQKYRSPYTGEYISLSKLFTHEYQIEHIIPQSRYFDDSLNNKVICEAVINANPYKDNQLGYEFIKNNEGRIVSELSRNGRQIKIFTLSEYEGFVKDNYGKNNNKMKNLLLEDIPDSFIERQLNDSRYISKEIKGLLSNIVREDSEQEATSKHVISCTGGVTATLKQEWGLNDIWNKIITPRFIRMNQLTNSDIFGRWVNKEGKNVFQTDMPLELQKGFNKKRIDHRHHAMDAIIIACATRSHVNYLNNESAKSTSKETRYDLKHQLCFKSKVDDKGNYKWQYYKPWDTFTQDTQVIIENIIISFKQNLRIINKSVNYHLSYRNEDGVLQLDKNNKPKKVLRKQIEGDSWAIRKPLHKDTVAGQVNLRLKKQVSLLQAIEQWETIVDKSLRTKIKQLIKEGLDKKKIQKFFANNENKWLGKDITKPDVYYFSNEKEELVASRVTLDTSFNSKKIESITDTGIQQILLRHLRKYNEEIDGKIIEHPELAFTPEAIEEMNKGISILNNGKPHQPILKVRTYEPKGNKFNVGYIGNKKHKYVEAAKGTNLFFAIYVDENDKRYYETIPLNIVIERSKNGDPEVPEKKTIIENGGIKELNLLFSLSPNDLVYVPTEEEIYSGNIGKEYRVDRIYKMVSSSGPQCFFIPHNIANPIMQTKELGANNKSEKSWDGIMIKQVCSELAINRIGKMERKHKD